MDRPDHSLNRLLRVSARQSVALRVGVLANSAGIPAYCEQVLQDILGAEFCQLVCVVLVEPSTEQLSQSPRLTAYGAYLWASNWTSRPLPDPEALCQAPSLMDVPVLRATLQGNAHSPELIEHVTEQVRTLDLDVLVALGIDDLGGKILGAARDGVWVYRSGSGRPQRETPALVWELIEDNPVSSIELRRLSEEASANRTLTRATFSSSHGFSVYGNRYAPYWSTTHFVIERLRALHTLGRSETQVPDEQADTRPDNDQRHTTPQALDLAKWVGRRLGRAARLRTVERFRAIVDGAPRLHWRIALRQSQTPLYESASSESLREFKWLESPEGRFWADPKLFSHDGRTWLFFEDSDSATGVADISVGELQSTGEVTDVRPIITRGHHVSYPQVFEHEGNVYLVPESAESGAVELWRATRFPYEWCLERRLIEARVVDPTIFRRGDCWWLLATAMPVVGHFAQTYLWHATQLQGPWKLHPQGAICSDIARSRGAGAIIDDGSSVLRPSQNCAGGYGRSIWFNQINALSSDRYTEHPVLQVTPTGLPGVHGIHTYSRAGSWEAIDGQFWIRGTTTP